LEERVLTPTRSAPAVNPGIWINYFQIEQQRKVRVADRQAALASICWKYNIAGLLPKL